MFSIYEHANRVSPSEAMQEQHRLHKPLDCQPVSAVDDALDCYRSPIVKHQPNIVLAMIALVIFIGALMEFDQPEPQLSSASPAYTLDCPLTSIRITDPDSGSPYQSHTLACQWVPRSQ